MRSLRGQATGFWRGDAARSDAGLHCGLGLTLCRRMTGILGGTITAASEDGSFVIRLSIPTPAAVVEEPQHI